MKDFILQDVAKSYSNNNLVHFIYRYLFIPSYRITIWFRLLQYLHISHKNICRYIVAMGGGKLLNLYYIRLCNKYCCYLPYTTKIGSGLRFPHNFPLVINPACVIGINCTIHPGVLIGTDRSKQGAPEIGDFCFLGDGCKILGNCKIGEWCFITPNAVVTKDIPAGSVVGCGINNIISNKGMEHVKLYL